MTPDFIFGTFSGIFLTSTLVIIQHRYYIKQINSILKYYYALEKKYKRLLSSLK